MALYFLSMKTFSRSNGSSAPSLAAYRSGERIRDERTRRTYDHTDRRDVVHKEIVLPARLAGADMSWATDRATLWNAAERAEKPKNARVAREYMIALPTELSPAQRVNAVRGFAQDLAERYEFAVDVVLHAPRNLRGSDPRNFHAHLLATTRQVSREGLGRKTTFDLNDDNRRKLGLGRSVEELFYARRRWAEVANAALESAHVAARIDHRSLAAQGITREPKPWIPRVPYEIERRGGHSFIAERIRHERNSRLEPQRAGPGPRDLAQESAERWAQLLREQEKSGARPPTAKESAERWAQLLREQERSGTRPPTAKESAEKWAQYLRDVVKLGEARAAEIHLQRTPADGYNRDYDFGL
jgi:ATP-dependent exoDNAse (exonuclease V) alpha subunit